MPVRRICITKDKLMIGKERGHPPQNAYLNSALKSFKVCSAACTKCELYIIALNITKKDGQK
jgi:hypothetical protein